MKMTYNFAYITLANDYDSTVYSIGNATSFIEDLKSLSKGNVLNIKGIGMIVVEDVIVDTNGSTDEDDEEYIYNDIEVVCKYPTGKIRGRAIKV